MKYGGINLPIESVKTNVVTGGILLAKIIPYRSPISGWRPVSVYVSVGVGLDVTKFNPFPNKPWFLHVCSGSLLKTLWEKEKLLIMSNFSFSYSFFFLFKEISAISIEFEIVVCSLSVWMSRLGKG